MVGVVEEAAAGCGARAAGVDAETLLRHTMIARFFRLEEREVIERVRQGGPLARFAGAAGSTGQVTEALLRDFWRELAMTDLADVLFDVAARMEREERETPDDEQCRERRAPTQ